MNTVNKAKEKERLALHAQGYTNGEMAEMLGISYNALVQWLSVRRIKGHKQSDVNGENERRYKAYLECRTDQEAADALGIGVNTFASWRWNNGILSKRQRQRCKDNSYVTRRPEWERLRMRHFGSFLESLPRHRPEDIHRVIEIYREEIKNNDKHGNKANYN